MPILSSSGYQKRPFYMWNPHMETVIPSMFFKVKESLFKSERIELKDGDFLDLAWIKNGNSKCLILSHGLEGDSERYYIKRAAKYYRDKGWDVLAWNCRSCGSEMNRLPRFYHHGDTDDLDVVVQEALKNGYEQVVLSGYSMGGSMSLKYLGEKSRSALIKAAVVFSVPCNLKDSAEQLKLKSNRFYEQRFLKKLVDKVKIKAQNHPELDGTKADELEDFDSFHDVYTAPLHGFEDKEDFFARATCDQYLSNITVPTLIVNAKNDPMLGDLCYPFELAEKSEYVFLEVPEMGGHVGFTLLNKDYSYMEVRMEEFLSDQLKN
ncbi:MAG: alpha/beta fold hydrolase [Cyclobacteriaceae bacterium]